MRLLFVLLETGSDGRWHPGIGDPTVMGWVTVATYAAAAFFSFEALRASRLGARKLAAIAPPEAENQRDLVKLWSLVTLAMVVLGLNKQLDLQSLFTEILRDMAKSEGWYEQRRAYQRLFIVTIGLVGLGGTLA